MNAGTHPAPATLLAAASVVLCAFMPPRMPLQAPLVLSSFAHSPHTIGAGVSETSGLAEQAQETSSSSMIHCPVRGGQPEEGLRNASQVEPTGTFKSL
jgi:hypothetical protein